MTAVKNNQGRIFLGLLLIALGGLFLLDQLDQLDAGDILSRGWPVIFILIGLSILIGNHFQDIGAGLFFIAFGVFFLLMQLRVLNHIVWHYLWPLLIIALGIWFIFGRARISGRWNIPGLTVDELNVSSVLSANKRQIESQNFKGGRADVVMGSLELDFTRTGLEGGQATIALSAVLGGIEVRVPREWQVNVHGSPVLGEIDDKTRTVAESEKKATLNIRASVVLGSIEIKD